MTRKLLFIIALYVSCYNSFAQHPIDDSTKNSLIIINDKYWFVKPFYILKNIPESHIGAICKVPNNIIKYKNNYPDFINIEIDTKKSDILEKCKWVDIEFLKNVDPKTKSVYVIDGIRKKNLAHLLESLYNKKIEQLTFLNKEAATTLYDTLGTNGATFIKTIR